MQTKLIILILVLLGVSACEMEKKFNDYSEEENYTYEVLNTLMKDSLKGEYVLNTYYSKRTPDTAKSLYPEKVYKTIMSILDSYGKDTNSYNRESIRVSVIEDSMFIYKNKLSYNGKREQYYDIVDNHLQIIDDYTFFPYKKLDIDMSKLQFHPNSALIKKSDYEKYLKDITQYLYPGKNFDLFYFPRLELGRIVFNKAKTRGYFTIRDDGAPLAGSGTRFDFKKVNNKWVIVYMRGWGGIS